MPTSYCIVNPVHISQPKHSCLGHYGACLEAKGVLKTIPIHIIQALPGWSKASTVLLNLELTKTEN